MTLAVIVGLFLVMAVTVEAIVEYTKEIVDMISTGKTQRRTVIIQLAALTISILLCFAAGVDVYAALGITFVWPGVGYLLTGIFASRGANYASDFIGKLNASKNVKNIDNNTTKN